MFSTSRRKPIISNHFWGGGGGGGGAGWRGDVFFLYSLSIAGRAAKKGYEPLAFRYLALTARYAPSSTSPMTPCTRPRPDWHRRAAGLSEPVDLTAEPIGGYRRRFTGAVADDLGTPRGMAIAHEVAADTSLTDAQRRALLLDFDRVLGLSLNLPAEPEARLPEGAAELLERRAAARAARDFAASDALREELAAIGVEVRDTADGQEARVAGNPGRRGPVRPG